MKKLLGCFLGVILLFFSASVVGAYVIDLTDVGATSPTIYEYNLSSLDGSLWRVIETDPTGTGVYQPFLRYQNDGSEIGMNSNAKAQDVYDNHPPAGEDKWTRAVEFSQLGVVTNPTGFTGTYWAFTIDINETASEELLSLESLAIYEGGGSEIENTSGLGIPLWSLEADAVLTDYLLAKSGGSGWDDIEFLVPVKANTLDYMYLYIESGFYNPTDPGAVGYGLDWTSSAGFEEIRGFGDLPSVPEPATMLLLGSGILGLALFGRQRFKK